MAKPQRLGPYRIGKPLGKGGMGTVYEALNEESGERVAVKTLSPELAAAEGFRERFEAEIESLRTLRHPNIVRLFGYGEESGLVFYAMELVDGTSLEEELRNARPFDWREVTKIAIQVSRALKHAHDHGIIHRDIKPANILLAGERAMLADFGIAQLFGGAKLTTARGVVGTADFMSPEQAESRPVTDRCDQYSLGCVMYALLAARPPFRAKSLPEMLQLQRYADPEPVQRFAPDTPKQLENVIMQLLEKSPRDRFPSAMALAKHLEAMLLALSRPAALQSDFSVRDEPDPPFALADLGVTPPDVHRSGAAASPPDSETLALPTEGPGDLSVIAPSDEAEGEAEPARRFTVVHDEPARGDQEARPAWLVAAQGAAALAIVAAVSYGVALLLQPPDADDLYARIATAAEEGDDAVVDAADDIEDFLERFPDDPRAEEVRGLRSEVAFFEAEDRLTGMLRRRADVHSIGEPLEALYVDAMRDAKHNPERALERLRAITQFLSPREDAGTAPADDEDTAGVIYRLAQQQIERLEQRVAERAEAQLPLLKQRLAHARRLRGADPAAAVGICRSVIDIYGDYPWAAEPVAEARAMLSELDGAR